MPSIVPLKCPLFHHLKFDFCMAFQHFWSVPNLVHQTNDKPQEIGSYDAKYEEFQNLERKFELVASTLQLDSCNI